MTGNDSEDGMDEIIGEFLVESYENLDQLDRDLVQLEQDPSNRACLASIFRTVHTIKGTSSFLGFRHLESLSHVGESLLSGLRDGKLSLNAETTSALLSMVDAIRGMLSSIEACGAEGDRDDQQLLDTLTRLQDPTRIVSSSKPLGAILIEATTAQPADVDKAIDIQMSGDPRHIGEILVEAGIVEPQDVVEALLVQSQSQSESKNSAVADASIRVDVGLLDRLMVLVGELVLARNQIMQFSGTGHDNAFIGASQRLNLITTELQEGVMKTRMQPIGNVWAKFPRVIRDLSISCDKQIRLEMEGRETELDRTIIEAIKDPLTHLLRNAVDHGIESPQTRLAQGKPHEGLVRLRAYHEGGHVNIEITDDGAGLDIERIKAKATANGLIRSDQLAHMTDREITNLIFLPGFSTAETVTNVSGRGVGMDVVKTNIEKIGGTIDVVTHVGTGSTFKLKIPLTLAIIPALIVTTGGQRYAIAQVSLLELVRLDPEAVRSGIEYVGDAPVYRLRGRLLPLVDLSDQLGVGKRIPSRNARSDHAKSSDSAMTLVVLQADGKEFGLVVESVNDTEEIVVKPLAKQLKGIGSYSGAAIMGDGRVALILDVLGVAQQANVLTGSNDTDAFAAEGEPALGADRQSVLVVRVGADCRAAVPLALVDRLEEIPTNSTERAGDREVVQYRGGIMALIRLGVVLGSAHDHLGAPSQDTMQVIVHRSGGRIIGLVVDEILDIVEDQIAIECSSAIPGVLGSAIIHGHVTDLLDVDAVIATCLTAPATNLMEALS